MCIAYLTYRYYWLPVLPYTILINITINKRTQILQEFKREDQKTRLNLADVAMINTPLLSLKAAFLFLFLNSTCTASISAKLFKQSLINEEKYQSNLQQFNRSYIIMIIDRSNIYCCVYTISCEYNQGSFFRSNI